MTQARRDRNFLVGRQDRHAAAREVLVHQRDDGSERARIERGKRLIEDPQRGIGGEAQARQRHAPLLALRKVARRQPRPRGEADALERIGALKRRGFPAGQFTRDRKVFVRAEFVFYRVGVPYEQQFARKYWKL